MGKGCHYSCHGKVDGYFSQAIKKLDATRSQRAHHFPTKISPSQVSLFRTFLSAKRTSPFSCRFFCTGLISKHIGLHQAAAG